MSRVPNKKTKNYTVSAPRHQKKVTRHATSTKCTVSRPRRGYSKTQKKITRTKSDKKIYRGKTKSDLNYRGKGLLTLISFYNIVLQF